MMCVKRESTKFLKTNYLSPNFSWQEGYGAFSYTKSHVDAVFKYIANQKEHHKKITSFDEMKTILKKLGFVNPYL
jgi:adenylate cyclase class IV